MLCKLHSMRAHAALQAHRQACAARAAVPAPSSDSPEAAETVVARLVASIMARAVVKDRGKPCSMHATSDLCPYCSLKSCYVFSCRPVASQCPLWGFTEASAWRTEVELLQRRVSRMARMEEAIERQQAAERAQRDSMQRRLLNCALAVRCTARLFACQGIAVSPTLSYGNS